MQINTPVIGSYNPGPELDPAVLAFVKWHVTSPLKWEAMRLMAEQVGAWLGAEDIARTLRLPRHAVERVMRELAREGVVEQLRSADPNEPSFRLPRGEASTLVLQRLLAHCQRSQEMRSIVVANILRAQAA